MPQTSPTDAHKFVDHPSKLYTHALSSSPSCLSFFSSAISDFYTFANCTFLEILAFALLPVSIFQSQGNGSSNGFSHFESVAEWHVQLAALFCFLAPCSSVLHAMCVPEFSIDQLPCFVFHGPSFLYFIPILSVTVARSVGVLLSI